MSSKQDIRKKIRAKRRGLSSLERNLAGLALLEIMQRFYRYRAANRIAVYMANDGELPLNIVVDDIWTRRHKCYLPVLVGCGAQKMLFANYSKKTRFRNNRYNIPEPVVQKAKRLDPMRLDLILMPLVGFDKYGNRLGMGGGYYDRSFAFLKRREHWSKPCLVGIAYDFQEVEELQSDPWDIPLDAIITPSRIIKL